MTRESQVADKAARPYTVGDTIASSESPPNDPVLFFVSERQSFLWDLEMGLSVGIRLTRPIRGQFADQPDSGNHPKPAYGVALATVCYNVRAINRGWDMRWWQ
jgi:hypothetical protein